MVHIFPLAHSIHSELVHKLSDEQSGSLCKHVRLLQVEEFTTALREDFQSILEMRHSPVGGLHPGGLVSMGRYTLQGDDFAARVVSPAGSFQILAQQMENSRSGSVYV